LNVFLNIRSTTLTFPISVSGEPSIDGSSRWIARGSTTIGINQWW
jgi:hypothetical protein